MNIKSHITPAVPGTLVFGHMFNYFGRDTLNGKTVAGATLDVAVRIYKEGREVVFVDEPAPQNGKQLSNVFRVSFDREKIYAIEKDLQIDNIFRLAHGWDEIHAEVVGFNLDFAGEVDSELEDALPEEHKGFPYIYSEKVSQNDFEEFLTSHADDFDISDNTCAQVLSFSLINLPAAG